MAASDFANSWDQRVWAFDCDDHKRAHQMLRKVRGMQHISDDTRARIIDRTTATIKDIETRRPQLKGVTYTE